MNSWRTEVNLKEIGTLFQVPGFLQEKIRETQDPVIGLSKLPMLSGQIH